MIAIVTPALLNLVFIADVSRMTYLIVEVELKKQANFFLALV